MSKKNLIKDIQDIKNFNIICSNMQEIKECLSIINNLGLTVNKNFEKYTTLPWSKFIVVHQSCCFEYFDAYTEVFNVLKNISFYDFKKETKKFLKPVEDIEYDKKTGRVIKINNYKCNNSIYIVSDGFFRSTKRIKEYARDYLDFIVYIGLAYISQECCAKAEHKMIRETEINNKPIPF